jgi:hypothetical protein
LHLYPKVTTHNRNNTTNNTNTNRNCLFYNEENEELSKRGIGATLHKLSANASDDEAGIQSSPSKRSSIHSALSGALGTCSGL